MVCMMLVIGLGGAVVHDKLEGRALRLVDIAIYTFLLWCLWCLKGN